MIDRTRAVIYASSSCTSAGSVRALWVGLMAVYALVVTVSRSLYEPNDFAEEHWLLGYRFGFIKRGLVGEVFQSAAELFSFPVSDRSIAIAAGGVFVLFCATLLLVCMRIASRSEWSAASVLVALVFLTSPFVVMSASIVGYYDNIVLMVGIAAIALLLAGHPWLAASLHVPAFLIHENGLLLVYPAFCAAFLLSRRKRATEGRKMPWIAFALPIAAFLIISINQERFVTEEFIAKYRSHLANFSFVREHLDPILPKLMAEPFSAYYKHEAHRFPGRLSSAEMHGLVLPSLLCFSLFVTRGKRSFSLEPLLLLVVAAAPQLMHTVAWDTARIWTYGIVCAWLAVWACIEVEPKATSRRSTLLPALIVLASNFVVITPLMGGLVERHSLVIRLCLLAPLMIAILLYIYAERRDSGRTCSLAQEK